MTVEVAETIAGLDRWASNVARASDDIPHEGSEGVRRLYQAYAPKLSGQMAGSAVITRVGPDSYVVGPTVVYGRIREIGGRIPQHSMSHPFLRFVYKGSVVYARRVHQRGHHPLKKAMENYERPYGELAYRKWLEAQETI